MNHPPAALFDQFLKERLYLKNVTPRTLVWYRIAFNSYRTSLATDAPPLPTRASLQQFLMQLRDRGIRPVTCNTYLAAMNAFCAWLYEEQHVAERVKLKKLKVERRVLELLSEAQLRVLIGVKPKTFREARLHLVVLLVLDTGLRISETLGLRLADIDADNLILKVLGTRATRRQTAPHHIARATSP